VAALLQDATLRPGDVVVFRDGPKVFKGGRDLPHAVADFESLERSRLVSKAARKMVLALTTPPGTLAQEAGRYLPATASGSDGSAPEEEAASALVRVVYPPTGAR